ncbi:hypothetical protein D3C80_1847080 [compost metagenome]
MVINAIEQQAVAASDIKTNTEQHRQLTEQLEQRDSHAAQEYHHCHTLHARVEQAKDTTPDRVVRRLPEQMEFHDG